jgi:hypothetical protein
MTTATASSTTGAKAMRRARPPTGASWRERGGCVATPRVNVQPFHATRYSGRGVAPQSSRCWFRLIWGWGCQGRRSVRPRGWRVVDGGVWGLACRGGAGCGSARRWVSLICETAVGLRTSVGRSVRCLKSSGATWVAGSQAKARTFVCARMPGPPRRLDAPDVVSRCLGGGDLPAGADKFAGDRDDHDAGRLAAPIAQQVPGGNSTRVPGSCAAPEHVGWTAALDDQRQRDEQAVRTWAVASCRDGTAPVRPLL